MNPTNLLAFSGLLALASLGCSSALETTADAGRGPGHDALGCAAGDIVEVATNQQMLGMALDSTNVYWFGTRAADHAEALFTVPKEGGSVAVVASYQSSLNTWVAAAAFDEESVYWATNSFGKSAIYARRKTGEPFRTLVESTDKVGAMAVDEERVYWTETENGTVKSVSKAGGEAPVLTGATAVTDETSLPKDAMALDHERVFWTTLATRGIFTVPKAGGETTSLGGGANGHKFVIDDVNLYWSGTGNGKTAPVMRMPKGGGAPTEFARVNGELREVAVNSKCVYWGTGGYAGVAAASKSGGEPVTVATVTGGVTVAADASGLYWWDSNAQTIFRLKK